MEEIEHLLNRKIINKLYLIRMLIDKLDINKAKFNPEDDIKVADAWRKYLRLRVIYGDIDNLFDDIKDELRIP